MPAQYQKLSVQPQRTYESSPGSIRVQSQVRQQSARVAAQFGSVFSLGMTIATPSCSTVGRQERLGADEGGKGTKDLRIFVTFLGCGDLRSLHLGPPPPVSQRPLGF
eukprot:4831186-Prymnesium_polylepis.1